jgi:hypothetical protein
MSTLTRLLTCVALALGVLTAAAALNPAWMTELGLDVWNLPELQWDLEAKRQRGAELQRESELVQQRIAAKYEIIEELAARKATLREAVARFRELDARYPACRYPGKHGLVGDCSDEEAGGRIVAWVYGEYRQRMPAQVDGIVARLEEELRQTFPGAAGMPRKRGPGAR